MRNTVILDPIEFLVTPASRVICDHTMHEDEFLREARNKEARLFSKLREGILDTRLLDILWKDRPDHIKILQDLLVKFGFFVPIHRGAESTSMESLYLVPYLLPKQLVLRNMQPKLVAYLFFAHKATMKDIRAKGYVELEEIRRDGFFPMGLGPAVIGQIVRECQCVHGVPIDDMQLAGGGIVTSFGRHKFLLREIEDLAHVLELVPMVDSSLLILERVLDLVGKTVEKMVKNLDFVLAVDQNAGVCRGLNIPKAAGPLVLISGPKGLQDRLDKGATDMSIAPGKRLSAIEVRHIFDKWLTPAGLRDGGYDVFVSYRWTPFDTELVKALFSRLSQSLVENRQAHVFVDRHRLEAGRLFQTDFAKALVQSTVAVPIVSWASLQRMLSLVATSDIDNVLLEWTLICELLAIGVLRYCLPILIGKVTEETQPDGKFITNLFATNILQQLPVVVCDKVVSFVGQLLRDNGLTPSEELSTRTVRGTVETITAALGVLTWDIQASHGGATAKDRTTTHSRDEWTRAVYAEIASAAIKCVEKAEMEGMSKVVGEVEDEAQVPNVSLPAEETAAASTPLPSGNGTTDSSAASVDEVGAWLQSISLEAYTPQIKQYGFDSLQFLDEASEEDMEEMTLDAGVGMKKFHRSIFMKAWKLRVAKREGQSTVGSADVLRRRGGGDSGTEEVQVTPERTPEMAGQEEAGVEAQIVEEEETEATTDAEAKCAPRWERLGKERCDHLLESAACDGAKSLNASKMCIIGEGRAGKTALMLALCNRPFEETDSTIGVQQNLLEVQKVDMRAQGGASWLVVEDGGSAMLTAAEAAKRRAAEIALAETPEERQARQEAARKAREEEERKEAERKAREEE